jgi:2,3,4,5-tetrahydropyridine-2-carboxylate N-succinyltransferase
MTQPTTDPAPGTQATERLHGTQLLAALERGELRVAERSDDGRWIVHAWIKEAILDVFRSSTVVSKNFESLLAIAPDSPALYRDKQSFNVRRFGPAHEVRVVPGGSAVRTGAYVAPGCVLMPPCYVNVGAWIGAGTMIDSHALVGSCAQIGARVHVSAAAQIGGVLEPANARPVIVEDDAFIGGNCGVYEGVLVRRGAVLAAGTILTAGTVVFDAVRGIELRGSRAEPLEIPERAVVVPGSRPLRATNAAADYHVACAIIVKYRDERTDRATALEDALR